MRPVASMLAHIGEINIVWHRTVSMRSQSVFLLLLSLLLPLSSAAQSPLEKFLNASFEPGQALGMANLSTPGYLVISADGRETYVFDMQAGKTLSDRAAIEGLLVSDTKSRTGFGAKLSYALGFAQNASAAKDYEEKKCMRYAG